MPVDVSRSRECGKIRALVLACDDRTDHRPSQEVATRLIARTLDAGDQHLPTAVCGDGCRESVQYGVFNASTECAATHQQRVEHEAG